MDELKTLEDLKCECVGDEMYHDMFNCCKIQSKQEAIKWIKELETGYWEEQKKGIDIKRGEMLRLFGAEDLLRMKSIIFWIKHFFNITDWDLLNEEEKKKYAYEHSHEIPMKGD